MPSDNASHNPNLLLWLLGLFTVGGATIFALPRASDQSGKSAPDLAKDAKSAESMPPAVGGYKVLQVLAEQFMVEPTAPLPPNARVTFTLEQNGASVTAALDGKPSGPVNTVTLAEYLTRVHPNHTYEYEFLIATVPDPVGSKFPHEFDAAVDGIQRAYEARGLLLRAAQLPWPRPHGRAGPDVKETRGAQGHPGVLLFRQARDPQHKDDPVIFRIAVVCLVGETPIGGLHQPSLTEALQARKDLAKAITDAHETNAKIGWAGGTGARPPAAIQIVAPYFTGSQTSLVHTLYQWKEKEKQAGPVNCRPVEYRIVNGSATGLRPIGFEQWGLERPESTVIPSELLLRAVLRFLAGARDTDLDGGPIDPIRHRVAILREANTGFGALAWEGRKAASGKELSPLAAGNEPLDLPFPVSISQLPAILDKTDKPAVALPHTDFVEPRLPTRDQTRFDTVPPYDVESAAATAGQSLRTIMTTIDRARVRYVGIVASDTRDVVFLNRLLQKECPRVRVFTTEPGIALLHPDEAPRLRGMLVGSTYPLAPAAQAWARTPVTPRRMIPFPTQGGQGYYNAVLAQCGRHDLMLGYHPPGVPGGGELDRPPIWISVIGQGGRLVPVHCFTRYEENEAEGRSHVLRARVTPEVKAALMETRAPIVLPVGDPLHPEGLPRVGISIGMMLGSLAAAGVMGVLVLALFAPAVWRKIALGATAAEMGIYGLRDTVWVWVWRGVMLAGVLMFALPFALPAREYLDPCVQPATWRHWVVFYLAWVIVVEILLAVVGFVLLGCRRFLAAETPAGAGATLGALLRGGWWFASLWWTRRGTANAEATVGGLVRGEGAIVRVWWKRVWAELRARLTDGDRIRDVLACFALALLVVGASRGALEWWATVSAAERFFLYVRGTDLTAGMSPLVPMCLLGSSAVVLGWCCLRQADLARRTRLKCPYPAVWSRLKTADRELRADLDNHLRFLTHGRHLTVTLGLGIPFVLCLFWNTVVVPLPSEEGRIWDILMRAVFWVTAGAVIATLARFLALWTRLAQLLEEILRVPMVGAFERLPHEIGRLFGGYLYSQRPRHRQLAAVAWALPPEHRGRLAAQIVRLRAGLAWVFGTPAPDPGPDPDGAEAERRDQSDRKWLADRLQEKAEEFLAELPEEWRTRTVDEAFGVGSQPAPAPGAPGAPGEGVPAAPPPPHYPKEEFVAAFVVVYLGSYFAQLRTLAYAIACSAPLLLFATASYPFQPDRPRLTALLGVLTAVALGTVYVLYRINKDGLISRVTRTTPNRFTPDSGFVSSIATYVLPLAALAILDLLGVVRFIIEPVLGLFD